MLVTIFIFLILLNVSFLLMWLYLFAPFIRNSALSAIKAIRTIQNHDERGKSIKSSDIIKNYSPISQRK